jgi:putative tricarboxylic transport membrane protein
MTMKRALRRSGFWLLVGLILGPLAEQQMRRALAISQGDFTVFVSSSIAATLVAITALIFVAPVLAMLVRKLRARGQRHAAA